MSIFPAWFIKLIQWFLIGTGSLLGLIIFINYWVESSTQKQSYDRIEDLPEREVALVLGTSKTLDGKRPNLFFKYRMEAAAKLFLSGKVKHLIVSGDNRHQNYNEPQDMLEALVALGVPAKHITMDYAGLRTLDSVVRSKKIFQQKKITIISQAFHNARALYIADYYGIDAIAYNATYPSSAGPKTICREYLARPKALLDLYILKTKPRYLGDTINIKV